MNDNAGVDIVFCEQSAERWEQLASAADDRAHKAAQYSVEVVAHLCTVSSSYRIMAAKRRVEAGGGMEHQPIDLFLSPR